MTDREMLERAARAAGYVIFGAVHPAIDAGRFVGLAIGDNGAIRSVWNPLLDDGDALRLAVTLGLRIDQDWFGNADGYDQKLGGRVRVRGRGAQSALGWFKEDLSCMAFTATRRAIVRAAAAMAPINQGESNETRN